ncbi:hypothetical protein [Paenibacillus sp. MMS20-IR301]|uniref:hypothetical protein n=1 Tax=Paenibacillus sp. MMS20-IR301 TaxID=2895946 RepID=UPI0028E705C0|nr:hypothetical protein [Paenibacillus sp. MMS20-IR301]WNS41971.1 hypothetical protein LOS79_23590 [Paenibacillus sp. MMS20-IR301]
MPVLTTNMLTVNPNPGAGPISQAVVKVVNNGTSRGVVYLTGLNNDVSPGLLFAQELFELNYREVISRTYNIVESFFQFNVVYTQEQIRIKVFLIDSAGVWIPVPLERIEVSRITSEFRDNIAVTAADFAAISFRRSPVMTIPEAVTSEIRADGVEILASTPIRYKIIAGGSVNGAFVNYPTPTTAIPVTETALQVNYTCTSVTGGKVIAQGIGSGIAGAYQNVAVNLLDQLLLYDLQEEPLTLVVSSLAGKDTLAAAFSMSEQW